MKPDSLEYLAPTSLEAALAIDEASLGAEHPKVAIDLNNLAALLLATNRLSEAEIAAILAELRVPPL